MPRDVGVVIVAAGQGRRAGGGLPKQYRELAGVPMLLRALRPFVAHPEVLHTVVALPSEDAAEPPAWLVDLVGGTLSVVAGGAERSDSVAQALAALPGSCEVVLVHDAARPLVERPVIDAVIAVARGGEGAVPAIPVGDTLKEATQVPVAGRTEEIHIQRTVPRERLYRAQTPQGFPRAILEEAHAQARHAELPATDDAAMVERLGVPVRLVPGSARNFKVTTEDDLHLADLLLREPR